ncbi:MAG: hypothetical protein K2L88_05810 [Clostridiales bacterium]|nr:hypothetical protein [Clostridiales bacterium]
MNQKITIPTILRRSMLVICAVFCFWVVIACSDNASSLPTLSGVYATDVSVEYDGRPHSISVVNTLPTDNVTYSADSVTFSSSLPSFTDVGTYTVYFKVLRSGYAEFLSSASVSISSIVLSDISSSDISFVYDGLAHSPVISGILSSDSVTYSTDGISFSSAVPAFTSVGEYTVYYCVERPYGEYRSSCTLTILPNIYGRYFHPDYGVIVISEETSFSVSGTGFIDNVPFSVADNVLTYNSIEYSILSDDEFIYRLNNSIYFLAPASGVLSILFENNIALIKLEDEVLLSLPNFNYCESGVVSDYTNLSFTQAFSASTLVTNISVELSLRSVNPITVDTLYFTYDGLPHGFDFSSDVIFLDDEYTFTEVGSYTVPVVFTSSTYLPKILDCTLVILPDVSGIFLSPEHVIQISGESFYFDGKLCGKLSVKNACWAWNDIPIVVTDNRLQYDGEVYSLVSSPVLAIYINDEYSSCLLVSSDTLQIHISFDGSVLTFTDNTGELLLSITLSCDTLFISIDGVPLTPLQNSATFVLGYSDLSSPVVIVHVTTE